MAKLSSHGTELYREELANCRIAYFEDGHILRDSGSGWKLYRKFKSGVNVRDAVSRKQSFRENVTPDRIMRNAPFAYCRIIPRHWPACNRVYGR